MENKHVSKPNTILNIARSCVTFENDFVLQRYFLNITSSIAEITATLCKQEIRP